ncbi:MAG TPA: hypothetical protein VF280_11455 [Burkholderiales bacterium]|jgi:hypothetical protein
MRLLVFLIPLAALAQEQPHELIGKVGTRPALLILHSALRADGSAQVAGEYVILPTLARRFVEGERSPELGVTVLKEGSTPILFGRPPTAELRGTWREGVYKGTRLGPGGQRREEFEFSEEFPALDGLSTNVRCEAKDARYQSRLSLAIEKGALKSLEWRVVEPGGQACSVSAAEQRPMRGALRFVAGGCRLTLRDAGELLALRAENCAAQCEADAHWGWLFIDKRGNCELLP